MTQISNIYDALRTRLAILYPNKKELSDAISIENNDELSLADGMGLHISIGNNAFRYIGCRYSILREITVTLTKAIRGTHKDIEKIVTVEKSLLEEHVSLLEDFEKNEVIGLYASKRNYISDSGIERIFGDKKNFVMIETTFEFEYKEDY